jgi:hypothetical protein
MSLLKQFLIQERIMNCNNMKRLLREFFYLFLFFYLHIVLLCNFNYVFVLQKKKILCFSVLFQFCYKRVTIRAVNHRPSAIERTSLGDHA